MGWPRIELAGIAAAWTRVYAVSGANRSGSEQMPGVEIKATCKHPIVRPTTKGRIACSQALLSGLEKRLSGYRSSLGHSANVYLMAFPNGEEGGTCGCLL